MEINEIKIIIAEGNTEKAIRSLIEFFTKEESNSFLNYALIISNRYNRLKKEFILDVNNDKAELTKINIAIIELIEAYNRGDKFYNLTKNDSGNIVYGGIKPKLNFNKIISTFFIIVLSSLGILYVLILGFAEKILTPVVTEELVQMNAGAVLIPEITYKVNSFGITISMLCGLFIVILGTLTKALKFIIEILGVIILIYIYKFPDNYEIKQMEFGKSMSEKIAEEYPGIEPNLLLYNEPTIISWTLNNSNKLAVFILIILSCFIMFQVMYEFRKYLKKIDK